MLIKLSAYNKNKALKSGIYGERRRNEVSKCVQISDRQSIIDIFVREDSVKPADLIVYPYMAKSGVAPEPADIRLYSTFSEYIDNEPVRKENNRIRAGFENDLLVPGERPFVLNGYCCACRHVRNFHVDFLYASERNADGKFIPNWRETLACEKCKLKNRIRVAVDLLYNQLAISSGDRIYATEQLTSFYSWLEYHFPNSVGSEYLGNDKKGGAYYDSLRHEDLTRLSFDDCSFDVVLSFDVLEHIPDTEKSLVEIFRCLKPGGFLLLSAPFVSNQYETIVRARIEESGEIDHLLEPEYHGNPVGSAQGSLCYYHFGWELLDQMRSAGASASAVLSYYSSERMNIGNEQLFFVALK